MADDYDDLSAHYHWLIDDELLSGNWFLDQHRSLFERLPPGATILDCACGIGITALALARRGYTVQASDGSAGMVHQARERAWQAGLAVPFQTCLWEDLPSTYDWRFDLVICAGNSLSHCPSDEVMVASLRGMAAVLNEGGQLLLDSRNWERLRTERPSLSTLAPRQRHGQRCIPVYLWHIPDEWHQPHGADVVLVFDQGPSADARRYPLRFLPFRFDDLRKHLAATEFEITESDFAETKDRYHVIAKKR